jgi:hypothetical protein
MSGERWRRAQIEEIGAAPPASDPTYWQEWTADPGYSSRWHSVREHFGIEAFGVNACEAAAGEELVVPHEEVSFGGQEELYAVVRGSSASASSCTSRPRCSALGPLWRPRPRCS